MNGRVHESKYRNSEPQFCGGFNNVESPRFSFPLGSSPIAINSEHPAAEVAALISFSQNPTTYGDFNNTLANGTVSQFLLPFFDISGEVLYYSAQVKTETLITHLGFALFQRRCPGFGISKYHLGYQCHDTNYVSADFFHPV